MTDRTTIKDYYEDRGGKYTMIKLYVLGIISGLAILFIGACTGQSTVAPIPEDKIIVRQSGGMGLLIAECGDRSYINRAADYIIEATVVQVESRWNEERTSILTYSDLSIEEYIKGSLLPVNAIQIIIPGGTVEGVTQWVEDQPVFHQGKKVRLYLKANNGEFSTVCAQFGVEEIDSVK